MATTRIMPLHIGKGRTGIKGKPGESAGGCQGIFCR